MYENTKKGSQKKWKYDCSHRAAFWGKALCSQHFSLTVLSYPRVSTWWHSWAVRCESRLSVFQQFHHLSCRNCNSFKPHKDFDQSSQTLRKKNKIMVFRMLTDGVCLYDKKVFCSVLQQSRTRPENELTVKLIEIRIKAFHLWKIMNFSD